MGDFFKAICLRMPKFCSTFARFFQQGKTMSTIVTPTRTKPNYPQLVVMLTRDDLTVNHAADVFAACKDSLATCWGMKEQPLPLAEMAKLYAYMKACGKTTFLEVVATTEEEGMEGAEAAAYCHCDFLL